MGVGIIVVAVVFAAAAGLVAGIFWGAIVLAYTGVYMPPPFNAASWWVGGLVLLAEIAYLIRQLWRDVKAADAYID